MSISQRDYISMSDKVYNQIEDGIRKSYPNSCILWIERIINPMLEDAFQNQIKDIETRRGKVCKIEQLYHGTHEASAFRIIESGFKVSANTRNANGVGTYFAKAANYSKDYAPPATDEVSFMLICDVIIGEKGIYGNGKQIDITRYDNSVDSLKDPSIVVTPYDNGAIPRYIVAFHRNAK